MKPTSSSLSRWIRFFTVGAAGFAIQIAILHAATFWLKWHYLISTMLAVESAIAHNFFWHEFWTWRDRQGQKGRIRRFCEFQFTNGIVSLIGNLLLMPIFIEALHVPVLPGNLASVSICSIFNYAACDKIVFR